MTVLICILRHLCFSINGFEIFQVYWKLLVTSHPDWGFRKRLNLRTFHESYYLSDCVSIYVPFKPQDCTEVLERMLTHLRSVSSDFHIHVCWVGDVECWVGDVECWKETDKMLGNRRPEWILPRSASVRNGSAPPQCL